MTKLSRSLLRHAWLAVVVGAALSLPAHRAAGQTDIIRGRVTGPDSQPVQDVTVTVTSLSGNVSRKARTDKSGRFTVTFPGDEGDYLVSFAAMGYAARRFEVKRNADEAVLVADTRLQRVAAQLGAVKVTAPRGRPGRNDMSPDISGTERGINNSAVPADQLGDLAAMAASVPGVTLIPSTDGSASGFSVLGLSPDQNNTTLNGLQFGASNIPRDAAVSSSLVTSPYDVSIGGFSGARFMLRSRPGSNFSMRTMSLNVDNPTMQWTDPAARGLGQQYSNYSLSGLFMGPLSPDKAFYNLSYQLGRRASDLQTILTADPAGLRAAGVAGDSVQRLLGILRQNAIPATVGGIPSQRLSDQGSLFGSVDINPPFSSNGQTYNVTGNGSWNRQTPLLASATELPAHSGDRISWNGGLSGRHTTYFGVGVLSETTVGGNVSRSYGTPYLQMPSGSVLVSSVFDDGTTGVKPVMFGGSTSAGTTLTSTSTSFLNQLSWFSADNKHRLKLTTELRRDAYTQDQTTNLLGTWSFLSLADLEAGRPAAFSRQLSPREVGGSQLVGGVSLGDSYKRTDNLQIQYGVRLDGNRFLSQPALNPALLPVFGVDNGHVPSRLYASPRLGFSYTYGTAAQIPGFEGALRGPRAVVRGGIGVFQNTPSTSLIGSAATNTGLPSAVQSITCVGGAAPPPDWGAYASDPSLIPTRCADGSTGTVFASMVPNVTLFDPQYTAARSVRSNLQWSGLVLDNRFAANVNGTYSLNIDQPGTVDLNFTPSQQFSLLNEAGRPVYAPLSSIVPATGAIASSVARVTSQFNHVSELRSDLRSESRQISVGVSPFGFNTRLNWNLSYVYSNVRDMTHGFSNTAGNPLDVAWGRSAGDSRHQLMYTLFYNFMDAVRVTWSGNLRSGTPYTPMIANDVNGDGYANDRAFIFDPAKTSDTSVASAMRSLLATTSGSARDCLRRQANELAVRNSCEGPWTHVANLTVSFNPMKVRMPQRATLSFQLANPLGAADLLLHGENGLHGWGQTPFPDPTLLYVRGFDPQSKSFQYQVNQRFGSTNPAFVPFRAPVTLTAMLRFDVGPTRERQMLSMTLDRGRRTEGSRAPEIMLKTMFSQGVVPNPMATILRQADTLKLSQQQADSIAVLNRWYTIRLDSIWSPVAHHLAALPDKYDQDEAYDRYRAAREQSIDLLIGLVPDVANVLTNDQQRKLPTFISAYLDRRYLTSIRSGTAGFGGPMMFMPMGGGMPAAAMTSIMIR